MEKDFDEILDEMRNIIGAAEDDSFSVCDVVWHSYFEPLDELVGQLERKLDL